MQPTQLKFNTPKKNDYVPVFYNETGTNSAVTGQQMEPAKVVQLTNVKEPAGLIGGIAGVLYGSLVYAYHGGNGFFKTPWVNRLWWAIIFGLAFHEIGEQVDRRILTAFKN